MFGLKIIKNSIVCAVVLWLATVMSTVHAAYVLPYPSYMPGHALYEISEVIDQLKYWWNWGSLSRAKITLALADKKIVEARVLSEYGQHYLATKAVASSDTHVHQLPLLLEEAKEEGKDIEQLRTRIVDFSQKHIEVITVMKSYSPDEIDWHLETGSTTELSIHDLLDESIATRIQVASVSAQL